MKSTTALRPVKAVLFDAVGTMLYADPPVAVTYHEAGRRFGSCVKQAEVERRFALAFAAQEAIDLQANAGRTDEARERRRWQSIVAEVFADMAPRQLGPLFETLWKHFAEPNHWALFDDVPPTWRVLEGRGLRLGLASNFDARLEAICQGHTPLAGCRDVFISSRLGWRKPWPEFFAAIERELGLAPGEILLVGDSLEHDYRPALLAGWQAILLRRDAKPLKQDREDIVAIRRLTELVALLIPDP
jgi:putative hydrolase of the HAD superfamily